MTTTKPTSSPTTTASTSRTKTTTTGAASTPKTLKTPKTPKTSRAAAAPTPNTGPSMGAAAGATLRALNPVTIAKTVLPVRQTPVQQIAFYGAVTALAAVGVIEAPLAAVVIGGHLLHRSRNPIAESVGEALDEAR